MHRKPDITEFMPFLTYMSNRDASIFIIIHELHPPKTEALPEAMGGVRGGVLFFIDEEVGHGSFWYFGS